MSVQAAKLGNSESFLKIVVHPIETPILVLLL